MFDLLIQQVHAYAPKDAGVVDIAVEAGRVTAIAPHINVPAARVIDGRGLTALPGLIETHAHMLLPFGGTCTNNDFYDGTTSGAFGGVTTLVDFADQVQGKTGPEQALDARRHQAAVSVTDHSFHVTLTEITPESLAAIPRLVAQGITSFKFYTAYKAGGLYVPPEDMRKAFAVIAEHGCIATVHAELDGPLEAATQELIAAGKTGVQHFPASKPACAEADAVQLVVDLARDTGCMALIRHISSAAGVRQVLDAQREGLSVYGETCPHYLCFTDEVYARPNGAEYIAHPSIRGEADRRALWEALAGNAVFTIGTDDCAFSLKQKHVSDKFYEVPGGMPGIETRLDVLYQLGVAQKRIGPERLADITSAYPAQIYGLYPQKGTLQPGSDADIVLLDTGKPHTIAAAALHEKTDYTPFEGMDVDMTLAYTISGGKTIVEGDTFTGKKGAGRLLKRGLPRKLGEIE